MDCVTAQQLVSDAMDKMTVDAEALKEAKQHCAECADCGAFVRAMLALQRTPMPEAPNDLPDRIVAQVREEANTTAYARARSLAVPSAASASTSPEAVVPTTTTTVGKGPAGLVARLSDPRHRTSTVAWLSAAAAVFILAGWGAVVGVRAILLPGPGVVEYEFTGATDEAGMAPSTDALTESTPGLGSTQAPSETPRFISLDDRVYRIAGPAGADLDRGSLEEIGTTPTDLGNRPGSGAKAYATEPGEVYVEGEDGNLYFLEAVTFSYRGQEYELISATIGVVGEWPALPAGVEEPRREDGYPSFEEANADQPDGVFVLKGQSPAEKIALPPNTPLVLPLSQCPNWTVWQLRR